MFNFISVCKKKKKIKMHENKYEQDISLLITLFAELVDVCDKHFHSNRYRYYGLIVMSHWQLLLKTKNPVPKL